MVIMIIKEDIIFMRWIKGVKGYSSQRGATLGAEVYRYFYLPNTDSDQKASKGEVKKPGEAKG